MASRQSRPSPAHGGLVVVVGGRQCMNTAWGPAMSISCWLIWYGARSWMRLGPHSTGSPMDTNDVGARQHVGVHTAGSSSKGDGGTGPGGASFLTLGHQLWVRLVPLLGAQAVKCRSILAQLHHQAERPCLNGRAEAGDEGMPSSLPKCSLMVRKLGCGSGWVEPVGQDGSTPAPRRSGPGPPRSAGRSRGTDAVKHAAQHRRGVGNGPLPIWSARRVQIPPACPGRATTKAVQRVRWRSFSKIRQCSAVEPVGRCIFFWLLRSAVRMRSCSIRRGISNSLRK